MLLATPCVQQAGELSFLVGSPEPSSCFLHTVQFLNLNVVLPFAGRALVPGDSQVDGVSCLLRVPPGWLGLSRAGWNGQDCPLEGRQGVRGCPAGLGAPALSGARH